MASKKNTAIKILKAPLKLYPNKLRIVPEFKEGDYLIREMYARKMTD